jgi:hypothetical protein
VPDVSAADVAELSAAAVTRAGDIAALSAENARLFGDGTLPLVVNEAGRVALPLSLWTPEQIAAEIVAEGLDTAERRSKVTVASGPLRDTAVGPVPVYDHFLGTDVPGTDHWLQPDAMFHLLRLASGWFDACVAGIEAPSAAVPSAAVPSVASRPAASPLAADPRLCTLHIGDLAYMDDRRPDPLGHKDHASGRCADIRLFRSDLSRYEAWWNRPDDRTGRLAYDAARTTAFLRWASASSPLGDVFFNDPAVIAVVPTVRALPGHDDHIHLCFREGA